MKIGIANIISDHLSTLQNAKTGKVSLIDLAIFYGIPLSASSIIFVNEIEFDGDVFSQSIAVFSIFSALLFSVQVALFGIYTKKRENPDEFSEVFFTERLEARRDLIRETNANISYLIFVSAVSVTIFLGSLIVNKTDYFEPSFAIFLYLHFILTLLMIIKRVHVLFDKEYELDSFD